MPTYTLPPTAALVLGLHASDSVNNEYIYVERLSSLLTRRLVVNA